MQRLHAPPAAAQVLPGCRRRPLPPRSRAAPPASAAGKATGATPQQQDAASLDVSGAVVQPSFRSVPWQPQDGSDGASGPGAEARIALVSESGVCRCVLAAAALQALLSERGLAGRYQLECRASRDYCLGEGADPAAAAVAAERGWQLPEAYQARQFEEARDIVYFDLVLVVDKFVAADVLREVSVFDTIQTWGKGTYTSKVRRLGDFAPGAAAAAKGSPDATDIEDALYGNTGDEAELQAVRSAADAIQSACEGLASFLADVERRHAKEQTAAGEEQQAGSSKAGGSESGAGSSEAGGGSKEEGQSQQGGERLGETLTAAVREMGAMDWLVPPMLQVR